MARESTMAVAGPVVAVKRPRRWKAIAVIAGVTVLLLLSLEILAAVYLQWIAGVGRRPFFINRVYQGDELERNQALAAPITALDPILGYGYDPGYLQARLDRIPGFVVYGGGGEVDVTIAALGGSTTDPMVFIAIEGDSIGERNWTFLLHRMCEERGKRCRIMNGGVGGFSSSQELLKLIRDVIPLKPRVVISLNGVNELYHFGNRKYPYIHTYQLRTFETLAYGNDPANVFYRDPLVLPNVIFAIKRQLRGSKSSGPTSALSLGTPSELQPHEVWQRNIGLMRAVAREAGIEYLVFLQPILGFGAYVPTDEERQWLRPETNQEKRQTYLGQVTEFYSKAQAVCRETEYCVDLTDIFAGRTGLYHDPRHPNADGNQLIAERILGELSRRQLIR